MLILNPNPSPAHLCQFWQSMSTDPTTKGFYAVTMPTHLEEFLAPTLYGSLMFWAIETDGAIAGAQWLHDILLCNGSKSGWFGSYYLPEFRGDITVDGFKRFIEAAESFGIGHVFGGTRATNRAAKKWAVKLGITHVGDIDGFKWNDGVEEAMSVYVLNPEDADIAMDQAYHRAALMH